MPFTPESMLAAEKLDRPHVIIDAADPLHFQVEWAYHDKDVSVIDPIVELFRPLRDKIRKEHDVHIVVTSGPWTDKKVAKGKISRTYILSYCPGERRQKEVDRRILASEFKAIQPRLLASLQDTLDAWVEADNGLALFLDEGNKESIHSFLLSIGLRKPESETEKHLTKEERREAYLKEHPEHAHTAKPRNKKA
ncbi:hypothetical protein IJG96_03120 [Candidatus Saccharibacteria bacterium]|nr:hypothetical protein [Candidatus Saccharibacteria bacterium]